MNFVSLPALHFIVIMIFVDLTVQNIENIIVNCKVFLILKQLLVNAKQWDLKFHLSHFHEVLFQLIKCVVFKIGKLIKEFVFDQKQVLDIIY
jgi:hypothetical protein